MTIRQVLDPNGFDSTSAFEIKKVSIRGLDGTAQEYTVLVGRADIPEQLQDVV